MGRIPSLILVGLLAGCRVSSGTDPAPSPSTTVLEIKASAAPQPMPLVSAAPEAGTLPEGMIGARHILVSWAGARGSKQIRTKEEAKKRIDEVLSKIRAGGDFGDLAEQYGEDATRVVRGDLGLFRRHDMVAAFSSAAFELAVGQVSEVVETELGYHLVERTR